jgi:hypothetical protein
MIAAVIAIIGGLYQGYEWYDAKYGGKKKAGTPGGEASVQSDMPHQEKASSLPPSKPAVHQEPTGRNTHPAPQVNSPQGNGADKEEAAEITRAEKKSNQAFANPGGIQENVFAKKEEAPQKRYAGLISRRRMNQNGQTDVGILIKRGGSLDLDFASQLSNAWSSPGMNTSTGVFTARALRHYHDFLDGTVSLLKETSLADEVDYYIIGEIKTEVGPNPYVEDMKTATIYFTGRLVSAKDGSSTPLNIEREREVGVSDQDALQSAYESLAQKLAEHAKEQL